MFQIAVENFSYSFLVACMILGYLKNNMNIFNHICSAYTSAILLFFLFYGILVQENNHTIMYFVQIFTIVFVLARLYLYLSKTFTTNNNDLFNNFVKNQEDLVIMNLNIYYVLLYFVIFLSVLFINRSMCVWLFRVLMIFFICAEIFYKNTLHGTNELKFADLLIVLCIIIYLNYHKGNWIYNLIILVIIFVSFVLIYYNDSNVYAIFILNCSNFFVMLFMIFALFSTFEFTFVERLKKRFEVQWIPYVKINDLKPKIVIVNKKNKHK